MQCDYTHLKHNSLVSQKKKWSTRRDYKEGLLYHTPTTLIFKNLLSKFFYSPNAYCVPKLRAHRKVFNFHQQSKTLFGFKGLD